MLRETPLISPLYIVVVGCGRLGAILASRLSEQGHNVVVIDRQESAFNKLSIEFSGFQIRGDAAELEVLLDAKVEEAQCLLAVTGKDNLNIMIAQLAKTIFKVPIVLTRILDPTLDEIYQSFSLTAISPAKLSAAIFLQTLEQQLQEVQS